MIDDSQAYIKKCEKAVEVQDGWEPKSGDCYHDGFDVELCCGVGTDENGDFLMYWDFDRIKYRYFNELNITWLPYQHQLQEMVRRPAWFFKDGGDEEDSNSLLARFENSIELFMYSWSMEQLWLAFVMREKFNKTWNGEDWE